MTASRSIERLRRELNGRVVTAEDVDYFSARAVYYGGLDRRPAVIIRAADSSDVARAIELARSTGLTLAVRSGGHSLAGHGAVDGGIVLDLRSMRDLCIDIERRSAWAEGGLTTGDYTTAVGAYGLATGFGDSGGVGIGGITLGGGVGFLVRKHGLTIDQLLAAEVVTADGDVLLVDAERHEDLFWAIRGGGGNFGVVTRFQFRLHELPTVVGGMMMLPATPEIIASFVSEAEAAPEELSVIAGVMKAPPMPFVPAEHHGRPVVMALMLYAGESDAGAKALEPFRLLATPIVDEVKETTYPSMFAPGEHFDSHVAIRSMFANDVDVSGSEAILEHLDSSGASMAAVQLRILGGAVARVPADATAYAHRHQRIMLNVMAMYQDPASAPEHRAWVDRVAASIDQGESGVYVNFLAEDGPERVRAAYPGSTWERLAEIKRRYDPDNVFRSNHNISPGTTVKAAGDGMATNSRAAD